jgi:hypothetical protein
VDVKLKSTAAVWPPRGDPTVNQFLRLCGAPQNEEGFIRSAHLIRDLHAGKAKHFG